MRTTQLARIAAQAEKLRLQRIVRRQVIRASCAAVAAMFAVAALVALHVWGAIVLAKTLGPATASAIVFGVDVVIALVLALVARRSPRDDVEVEAKRVRDRALAQMKESLALTALLGPFARLVGGRKVYGATLAGVAFRSLFGRRRK